MLRTMPVLEMPSKCLIVLPRRQLMIIFSFCLILEHLVSSARSQSVSSTGNIIETLPGYQGRLPFQLETGYVGVGDLQDIQLFYYFIESQRNPDLDPLLVWLTGGPGCAALSGFFYEVGPLQFDYATFDGNFPMLIDNPYSFTQIANMLFLDAPVGTGFSYSKSYQGYYTSDTAYAEATYELLRKWLTDHPRFLKNQLYITGDSYSGKIIPMIVRNIEQGQKSGNLPNMNLRGYTMGNPVTDGSRDINSRVKFAHRLAFISDKLYKSAKENCNDEYVYPDRNNTPCINDILVIDECIDFLFTAQILEPNCQFATPGSKGFQQGTESLMEDVPIDLALPSLQRKENWCRKYNYILSYIWANDQGAWDALRVRKGTKLEWMRCNKTLAYDQNVESVVGYHHSFFNTSYRALVYSGDHDMVVPYVGTQTWIAFLNMTVSDPWRPWFVDGQVAGYTESYCHDYGYELTFATIKGAGHTAPEYKPKQALEMMDRWLSHFYL